LLNPERRTCRTTTQSRRLVVRVGLARLLVRLAPMIVIKG
jgi:hypothetical protein